MKTISTLPRVLLLAASMAVASMGNTITDPVPPPPPEPVEEGAPGPGFVGGGALGEINPVEDLPPPPADLAPEPVLIVGQPPVTHAPEPASIALLLTGLAAIFVARRKRITP